MERKGNCSSENVLYYARILFVWVCLLGQVGHVVAKRLKVEVETPGTLPELVGEGSQIQGDGPDAERNIEQEGFVLPARNGWERTRAAIHTGTFARVGHAVRFFCPWRRRVRKTRGMERGAGRAYASALFVQRMWIDAYRFARTVGHHRGRGFGSHTRISRIVLPEKCVCGCFCLLWEQRIGGSGFPRQVRGVWKGCFRRMCPIENLVVESCGLYQWRCFPEDAGRGAD